MQNGHGHWQGFAILQAHHIQLRGLKSQTMNGGRGRSSTRIRESIRAEIRADLYQRESMWIRVNFFLTIVISMV